MNILNQAIWDKIFTQTEITKLLTNLNNKNTPFMRKYYWDPVSKGLKIDVGTLDEKRRLWNILIERSTDLTSAREKSSWHNLLRSDKTVKSKDGQTKLLLDLTYQDMNLLIQNLDQLPKPTEHNIQALVSLTRKANTQTWQQRAKYYKNAKELFSNDPTSKIILKLKKKIANFDKYEVKAYKENIARIEGKGKPLNIEEKVKALEDAKGLRRTKEYLYYGCRSKSPNVVRATTSKAFKHIFMGASLISTHGFFVIKHAKEFKDNPLLLTLEMEWEVVTALLMAKINSSIVNKTTTGILTKTTNSYWVKRGLDVIQSPLYAGLFKKNKKKAEKALSNALAEISIREAQYKSAVRTGGGAGKEKPESTPNFFVEYIETLLDFIEQDEKMQDLFRALQEYVTEHGSSEAMLEDPEGLEMLIEIITQKVYWNEMGGWLKTGDIAMDRFIFNTIFNVPRIPMVIGVASWAYRSICVANSSGVSRMIALGGLIADSFFGNWAYFASRKWMIGQ